MATATTSPRYLELDALRGFAVMGILLMNIIVFSMPEMAYISPAVYGGTDTPDIITWALSFIFVDGKMRGLFSLLFGASMILITERAAAKGESAARVHYNRMLWLAVFGLAHFFFLWWGDILFLYAAIGCIAFLMRGWDAQKLLRRGIIFYAIGFAFYLLLMGSMFFLQYGASLPSADAATIASYNEMVEDLGMQGETIAEEIALHRGSYWTILQEKVTENWFAPLVLTAANFLETLPFMMIGMALYKNGFLLGKWEPSRYRRLGLKLSALGILLLAPITYAIISSGYEPLVTLNAALAWSMPSRLLMTIGYIALLVYSIQKFSQHPFMHRVAAVGRAAFTNYLATSLLMTFIFYGWGLGLYGQVGRAELYLFVPGAWALMLLWSKPWLMRFRFGPLEWLWRSLARFEIQSMRISR